MSHTNPDPQKHLLCRHQQLCTQDLSCHHLSYTHPTCRNGDQPPHGHMKAVQSKGIKYPSPGPRLVLLPQQASNPFPRSPLHLNSPAAPSYPEVFLCQDLTASSLDSKQWGKRTEGSPSSYQKPVCHSIPSRDIIQAQQLGRDYSSLVADAQIDTEDTRNGNSCIELQTETLTQSQHNTLTFNSYFSFPEAASGLQRLQKLSQLL